MPFSHFTSPATQWELLPSFLVGEWLFLGLFALLTVHAVRSDRAHRLVWLAALLAGTANDLIFMALPLVDNFWHGQATLMLTPRLPLYIPCLYVVFLYLPVVGVRRFGLRPLPAAALTGLFAVLFYAPFDIVGAKLLWWTWHDTDLPIAQRILGAPASSTLWVLTFSGSFAWLANTALARRPEPRGRAFALGLLFIAGLTTLLMLVQVTALQLLDGGAPGYVALGTGVVVYALVAAPALREKERPSPAAPEPLLYAGALVHFATLALIIVAFDPRSHRSAGVHQEVGPCGVEAQDITGLTRHRYLCARDFDEDYTFDCVDAPPDHGERWYTVCGRAHTSHAGHIGGVGGLGTAGAVAFGGLLLAGRRSGGAR